METVQFLYAFDGIQKLDSTPNNSPRHTCASRHSTRVEKHWVREKKKLDYFYLC